MAYKRLYNYWCFSENFRWVWFQIKQNMDRSTESWLQDYNIEMYLTCNEGKSVVAERLVRILKNKISKYMTLISKYVYIYKLADIVN